MSFPLITFLYIYFFTVLIFIIGSIFVFYHLIRFGFNKGVIVFCTVFFLVGAIVILVISTVYILQVDWALPVNLFFDPGAF